MNMKNNIFKISKLFLFGLFLLAVSCQKQEYDKEFSSTYPISGDWTITVTYGTSADGPYFMKIYNTSFSEDSIWIDDNNNFWPLKAKAKVDLANLSFSATNSPNPKGKDAVTFRNAKVVANDSIYFEAEFTSDPGTIYKFGGHRKLSYEEYNSH